MKIERGSLRIAATDVTTFAACAHASNQNVAVAKGERPRPKYYPDPSAELLRERGDAHEAAYLAKLKETRQVVEIDKKAPDAAERTLEAMRAGAEVIYQGVLRVGSRWFGIPDFLVRVETPSDVGPWSYEPSDAKLAREAKPNALLQLCFYAELLREAQGLRPRRMSLVLGDMRVEEFATARYEAYFRHLKKCFEAALESPTTTYPEPVAHCHVCDYAGECDERWHADDHLSLVAGITANQRHALEGASVRTVRELARLPLLQPSPVPEIGAAALVRIREQARIQIEGRDAGAMRHELLRDVQPGCGLGMLPEPTPGDLFIDFEGDPYALGDGLEYLLGIVELPADVTGAPRYTPLWAFDRTSERAAFEKLIAFITERRARVPGMHVYHYNHYEPTALKRLAGRYATCIEELDLLLTENVFVDLYRAVRQGVRASVESYSLKKLEPLFGFERNVPLRDANRCLSAFEAWMAHRQTETPHDELRDAIEGYNRDDCVSALRLRDWLEQQRAELVRSGVEVARPGPPTDKPGEEFAEKVARVRACAEALLHGVPEDAAERSEDDDARYVLAHLLEWHRREDKSAWWEYHRLRELSADELVEDKSAIGRLTYEGVVGKIKRSLVHRYRFPPQDHAIDRAPAIHDPRTKQSAGELVKIDDDAGFIDLKRAEDSETPHPEALIPSDIVGSEALRESLLRLADHVLANGFAGSAKFDTALALLRRSTGGTSVLPVQGPPGSGKTYQGARRIVALLEDGKRVGITANSHKVITTLLEEVCLVARESGTRLQAVQRGSGKDCSEDPAVRLAKNNDDALRALRDRTVNVIAGTAWLWALPDMEGAVDVLFVDEAGQISLANVLAAAPAARGLVLLGDPQQLDQPRKGVHPPGSAWSALGRILGECATMDADRGLFLEETWRMHPDVCAFISEVFYERRLRPRPDLSNQRLDAPAPLAGTGLRFIPVEHSGNKSESTEEADVVVRLVQALTSGEATWTDRHGKTRPIGLGDVLIVAPYNAHVDMLAKRLPEKARVGTVDKFQGQQAPVVIYTMATSTPSDAPRGPEFLYSGNRFNVAISRARCAAFLVASPALFELRCNTERQMTLANAFCRYLELATVCNVAQL